MIDLTIVSSVVLAIAIYKVLEIFSDYLALKIHTYRFKKRLSKLEYKYESWLGADWDECDDECDICDEMDAPAKKPVKKTAKKKAATKKKTR